MLCEKDKKDSMPPHKGTESKIVVPSTSTHRSTHKQQNGMKASANKHSTKTWHSRTVTACNLSLVCGNHNNHHNPLASATQHAACSALGLYLLLHCCHILTARSCCLPRQVGDIS